MYFSPVHLYSYNYRFFVKCSCHSLLISNFQSQTQVGLNFIATLLRSLCILSEKWHVAHLNNVFWRFLTVIFPKGEKLVETGEGRVKNKKEGPRLFLSKKLYSSHFFYFFFNIIMSRFIGGCDISSLYCFSEKEDK